MTALPKAFLDRPLTHRGLHDAKARRIENSLSAVEAAIAHGYGIELDVQLTRDKHALVFHDFQLERLTGRAGSVRNHTLAEMTEIPLLGADETPPPLAQVLERVGGRVPVLIEIKSQFSPAPPEDGALAAAIAHALEGYDGAAAVMSFNPAAVAPFRNLAPQRPLGLVTEDFTDLPGLRKSEQEHLNAMADFDRIGARFISHDRRTLRMASVLTMKDRGVPILTWTVRSPAEAVDAREVADNITFEGFLP